MNVSTAVVLAAGEGTRLRPLTRNRPKPMLPAANRPILEHVFDALVEAGMDQLVCVVGYKHDRVQDHFGPSYRGVPIQYVRQHKQLGSGHALLQARAAVDGPPLVVNGDRLIEASMVEAVAEGFERHEPAAALAVMEHPDAGQYGAVVLENDELTEIIEKPTTGEYRLINAGIYAFDASIFDEIADTPRSAGELALTDTIARLAERERVRGVRCEGMWVDATYPWDLLTVARTVLARGKVDVSRREDSVWVHDEARVHDAATLRPPVVVGPDSEIGPGAVVGPDAALGYNVTVGANATVERTVLDADARVDAGSVLIDTVTGQNVDVGAGSVVPGGQADVRVGNEVFEDQRLGAVLADRVTADGDVSFDPGTLVGPSAHLHTGAHVRGQIPDGAEVMR
ncbi:nucleotidyl transferase [Halorientalis sp. IM1011]|uniref:bifunctional sugar-1-phosphate nucleotidylyltransferase/acetyltransferase n=1 Tax=Halorientalis sp. IM1011 TaxID=1932360 RepID=UPI00097CCBDF|nr:bifunctional sugar-1-phosphate nucleotidylyltransferase/acetyltransferase [Halorientalis sp. IM1011]AQL43244.1 nucleotidyl transferase [Halorientalis sp. IM1011]